MKVKCSYIFILICLCAMSVYGKDHSLKNLYLYGDSAASLGRGGTGVTSRGVDMIYINPASIAGIERFSMGIQYGTLDGQYYNPHLSLAVPTAYGVLGGFFRFHKIHNASDLDAGYSFSLAGAKMMTPRLAIGMSCNVFYGTEKGDMATYLGISLGGYYRFSSTRTRKGFGLTEPKIGISINAGWPFGPEADSAQFNTLTLGYSFAFFKHKYAKITYTNELSFINLYQDYPVKFGLETEIYRYFIIRAGFIVPRSYDYGDFTCGTGFRIITENFEGTLNYAFNLNGKNNYTHYVGLNMEIGSLDTSPPETEIGASEKFISPNHDGVQDFVMFSIDVADKSRIQGWQLQIKDEKGTVVKGFQMSERDIIQGLTFKMFFKRMFQKKVSLVVPEKILWDGTDSAGKVVNDGKYSYTFYAWDERDNIANKKQGVVIVDNTLPEIAVTSNELLFSPNGDNQKDILIIKQIFKSEPGDIWTAGFKDSKGMIVKSFKWSGNDIPHTVIWDGNNDNGANAPEGLYSYFISTVDYAGNRASAELTEIALTREYEVADVTVSQGYFSYQRNSEIKLFPRLSKTKGLEMWKVEVFDSKGNIVRTFSGNEKIPPIIQWDCLNDAGEKMKDGEYSIKLSTVFTSGNRPASFEKKVILDSTSPAAGIQHRPDYFSPDNDGENDVLVIRPKAEDNMAIRNWSISIYAPAGDVFKTFAGNGDVPDEILWDGVGSNMDIVESAADYYIELEATDRAGNATVSERDKLQVDILVIVTERGLKMRISNIEFAFGRADILEKGQFILDRVAVILRKYENYDVIIEGHTDDIGEEDYNLKLSEERAASVQVYLISKGIEKERLQFIGMGETVPLYPNRGSENRRRNRRVEFLLIKKGQN